MKRSFIVLPAVILLVLSADAQITPPGPDHGRFPEPTTVERIIREIELRGPSPRKPVGEPILPDLRSLGALTTEELNALAEATSAEVRFIPPLEYIRKYYAYVTSDTMGMARLFPEKNCGRGELVTVAELERCADVPQRKGGGSLYAFRWPWFYALGDNAWILHFTGGKFVTGNDIVQGVIADIGDADIESVGLSHKAFEFLGDYDPRQKLGSIREQSKVLGDGIAAGGYSFTNAAPVKNGSTYALRSIVYRYREKGGSMPRRGFDQYIVFKVVGQEPDGSVIIIWKELKRDFPRRRLEN